MKFEVARSALLRAVHLVSGVVERRQTLSILSNVRLVVEGDELSLTGTDLELEMVARIRLLKPAVENGDLTLPARKLADLWRSLPDDASIAFSGSGERLTLRSGRTRFTLSSRPSAEFPSFDVTGARAELNLAAEDVQRLINRTSFAMAQQDVRYFLNGLLFEVAPGHVRTVATDGHRLALTSVPHDGGEAQRIQAIVPRKAVQEISRLVADGAGQAKILLGDAFMRVTVGEFTLTTKLVDGKFPDYEKVIPKAGAQHAVGSREALRQAFTRAAVLSNEKYRGVRLVLAPGLLTVHANNPEQEEAEESVVVETAGEGLEISFNVSYLQEVLAAVTDDTVRINLSDSNSSALIDIPGDDSSVYVVMPMRL